MRNFDFAIQRLINSSTSTQPDELPPSGLQNLVFRLSPGIHLPAPFSSNRSFSLLNFQLAQSNGPIEPGQCQYNPGSMAAPTCDTRK